MEISALQISRAAYQPKLPKALQGPVKAVEGEATQSVGNRHSVCVREQRLDLFLVTY